MENSGNKIKEVKQQDPPKEYKRLTVDEIYHEESEKAYQIYLTKKGELQ